MSTERLTDLTAGALRRFLEDKPDEMPIQPVMIGNPPDNFAVEVLAFSTQHPMCKDDIALEVAIIDMNDEDDEEEDDEEEDDDVA